MCGIIGIFNQKDCENKLLKGLKKIQYRGMDNFGIVSDASKLNYSTKIEDLKIVTSDNNEDTYKFSLKNTYTNFALGHALHSIVGFVEQPFENKDNKTYFSSNCEIYNWKELKDKYNLKSNNDSELIFEILNSKEEFNSNVLKEIISEFDGVYAFSYFRDGKLYLARDLLGIKPIWYTTNEGFAFSSEKKALKEIGYLNINELVPRKILEYNTEDKVITYTERDFFEIDPVSDASHDEHMIKVKELLMDAIKKRIPNQKFGILFSGGIDSTVIAKALIDLGHKDIPCYTAVFDHPDLQPPKDFVYATKIAKQYNLNHKVIKITLDDIPNHLKEIIPLIEDNNVVKVGVALTFYAACKQAKEDGCKVLLSGLGSEEIFAGYNRHKQSQNVNKECLYGLLKIYERDLYRDDVITMNNQLELRLPFLDLSLIKYALKIPVKYKLDEEGRTKVILREVSEKYLKIDHEYAFRKKVAAQYGSNFHKALIKLTKKSGKQYISDYLNQFYAEGNVKLGALFSSGKDSSYALHVMQKQNYPIKCLISLKSDNQDSYMFHTPNIELVDLQAEAMEIPLLIQRTKGEENIELEDLRIALTRAKEKYGIEGVVTGALFSNYQRDRIEKICDELGLKNFSPLWHIPQEQELREVIREGFKVTISSIAAYGLDKSWINRILTEEDVVKLEALNKKYQINVAGEGGEYESLVLDGPMFKKRLELVDWEVYSESEEVARLIVKKAILVDKKEQE